MNMSTHHDFSKTCWGHSLESIAERRFAAWSTPRVRPGDTISYITHDKRRVTYSVREKDYRAPISVEDMAIFTVKKKRLRNEPV